VQSVLLNALPAKSASSLRAPPLALWMAVTITAIAALASWDEERESEAALTDFAHEQETLAHGISVALAVRMAEQPFVNGAPDVKAALATLTALDDHASLRVFVASPARELIGTEGPSLRSPPIARALESGSSIARLSRAEAAAIGLQKRSAVAGIWPLQIALPGRWAAVAVATAGAERDRETRATWRLISSVGLASGLVLLFGGVALRRQRRQLELARELSMQALARERDERLERADKLATLGAMATGIAHEVSTPLGVIIGRAEQLLPRVAQEERAQRALTTIIDQAHRINQVVRGMLALARGLTPTLEHVDPGRVARAACELVSHRFAKAGVELQLEIAPQLPQIACEPGLFEQVLVNLLLNACDACVRGGHVQLEVCVVHERVALIVLDDGAGISPLAAARATEPFFTTKPDGQGTGLGLAIANEIIKHHHGTLALGPREDRAHGTRAAVELPSVRLPA
jgi:two-component system NtrC family sensor kinase